MFWPGSEPSLQVAKAGKAPAESTQEALNLRRVGPLSIGFHNGKSRIQSLSFVCEKIWRHNTRQHTPSQTQTWNIKIGICWGKLSFSGCFCGSMSVFGRASKFTLPLLFCFLGFRVCASFAAKAVWATSQRAKMANSSKETAEQLSHTQEIGTCYIGSPMSGGLSCTGRNK